LSEVRFFRLTNWDKHQNFRGKRAHWMKLSLDFFDDPVIVGLPDSQRLAFIGVMILCGKRGNLVPYDATYVRKRCSLRVTPDLELFMREGLIEFTQAVCGAKPFPRYVEESRGEEKRVGTEEQDEPAYVPPPEVRTENAIRKATIALESKLLRAVGVLSQRTNRDALSLMREVTAYKARDGTVVPGRSNPSGMTSERLEKSIADAEGWIADLDKKAASQ